MKHLPALAVLALLAACGADGEPERPTVNTTIGINSSGDVSTATSVTASSGNVSLTLGL
ncbi:hypothetical protein [Roseovarius faecimaris]|uniref:hypothetical protein n=1 Tax=Roseovarius faecimaris TaxID=2494550 RepID=UPI0018DF9D45|nr:hypothetical protein [Roseovarius faecimaris]